VQIDRILMILFEELTGSFETVVCWITKWVILRTACVA